MGSWQLRLTRWLGLALAIALSLIALPAIANMASPEAPGDYIGDPIGNVETLDILHETLSFDLSDLAQSGDKYATVSATYVIENTQADTDVALLFVAQGLETGEVRLDDIQIVEATVVDRIEIPEHWDTPLSGAQVKGLAFTVPLATGEHTIRVKYQAFPGLNEWDVYRRYTLDYLLAPAAQWRSFGGLTLNVTIPPTWTLESSLPLVPTADPGGWQNEFDQLPADVLSLNTQPAIPLQTQVWRQVLIFGGWLLSLLICIQLGLWPGRWSRRFHWPRSLMRLAPIGLVALSMTQFVAITGLGHASSLWILEAQYVSTVAKYHQGILWLLLIGVSVLWAAPVTIVSYLLGRRLKTKAKL